MGMWTHFEGKIVLHNVEHVSINKAFKEFFDGHEATIHSYQPPLGHAVHQRVTEVSINIEEELEDSLQMFEKFLDHIKKMCDYPKLMQVYINVEGRIVR